MKCFYIALLAILMFSGRSQAQEKSATPVKHKKGQTEQGATAKDGRRVGKWYFYGNNDELELTFDYDSSRITYRPADTTRYLVRVGSQWELQHPTRAPRLIGSSRQRAIDIATKLRYPVVAMRQQQQGRLVMSFTVDTDGHTKDYIIENSVSPECDQEVWRVVKDLPDNWIPAVYQGQLVAARFYVVVHFRLSSELSPGSLKQGGLIAGLPPIAPAGNHFVDELIVNGQISKQTYIR
ncbi:energy transducer TonB [Hymenobacter taeanensis]|uniref:Energy transducer TonB n=1 Tax=Hymenobacter taeanensis TaxID=2735321 RepID=A0A6M6BDB1_9BACT|nr:MULTISPECIES: energy transducer TonB [Hymenobacter]QJX45734.1 energy transducer TonB [Hymenobacter taeanensis]UOQ79574.1 energy transducer TonB [Hymenobacter sp. 5414T-23]